MHLISLSLLHQSAAVLIVHLSFGSALSRCLVIKNVLFGRAAYCSKVHFIYLFIMKIVHKVQTKIKTKGRKTKANPYGSSLRAA